MKNKTDFLCSPINLFIAGTSSNNSKYDSYTTSHPEFCSSLYSNETYTKESNVSSTATCFNSGVERQSLMNNDNVSSEANRQSSCNDGLESRSFKVERQSLLNNGSDFRSSQVERLSLLNICSDQNSLERQPLLNNDSLQSSFEKFSSENNSSWHFDNSHSAPQFSFGNSRKHVCENQRLGSLAEDSIDFPSRNCNKIKKDITALEQTERKHFIQDDLSKEQPCLDSLVPHSQSLNSETNDINTLGKGTLQEATDHYNENETSSENESIHCDGNRTKSENGNIDPMGVMSDIENIQHNIMESMSENESELKQFSENILPVPDEQIKKLVCNIISVDGMKSSSITSMKINSCSTGSLVHPVQEVGSRIQSRRSSFCDLKRNFSGLLMPQNALNDLNNDFLFIFFQYNRCCSFLTYEV